MASTDPYLQQQKASEAYSAQQMKQAQDAYNNRNNPLYNPTSIQPATSSTTGSTTPVSSVSAVTTPSIPATSTATNTIKPNTSSTWTSTDYLYQNPTPVAKSWSIDSIINDLSTAKTDTTGKTIAPVNNSTVNTTDSSKPFDIANASTDQLKEWAAAAKADLTNAQTNQTVLDQAKTVEAFNKNKDYLTSQNEITNQIKWLQVQNAEIASSQVLKNAGDQLDKMDQTLGYLGIRGNSQGALAAAKRQNQDAHNTFAQLVQTKDNEETMRKLSDKFDASSFEKQMSDLQDKLNSQVSVSVQAAINSFVNQSWKVDTVDEVNQLRNKILNEATTSIEWLTLWAVQQKQLVLDTFNSAIADAKEKAKNSNTVNKEMSSAMWYYVDGNGEPLRTVTWATIPHAKDTPEPSYMDKESGRLFTSSFWPNGEIVWTTTQVVPQEVFSAETISNIVQSVKNGTLSPDQAVALVPKSGREALLQQLSSVSLPKETKAPNIQTYEVDWVKKSWYFDSQWQFHEMQWQVAPYTWEFWDLTSIVKRTGNNVGKDTNNPWNIMADTDAQKQYAKSVWAIGFYKSPNGRTYAVFNSMDDGKQAMMSDLQSKLNWWSSWATPNTTLANFASGWVSWPNAPTNQWAVNNYVKFTWYQANTPIGQIPVDVLANAIMKNEWVDPTKSATISWWQAQKQSQQVTIADINKFNDNTFDPSKLKTTEDKQKYQSFLESKQKVMTDKNASIQDIISYSAWWKELDATAITRLDKYSTVLWQLDWIQKQISWMSTWPVIGKLRSMNPYDTDAQVLKAQLSALIPNLARWVYGEVGVLTDNDIKNYAQTIPNLTQTKDVQNAILALTLDTLAWWYKNQLQTLAASKRDVSWFAWLYESVKWQADQIKASLWIWNQSTQTQSNIPAWVASPTASKPSSQANADYLKSLWIM